MKTKTNKIILLFICIFIVALFFGIANATWIYIESTDQANVIQFIVPNWEFDVGPIETGQVIVISDDGTITVDGQVVDNFELENPGDNESFNNGTVDIKVEMNEEGDLVLTEFTTTSTSTWSALFSGNTVYLPSGINIDGTTYPITGVEEPLDINVASILGYKTSITVNIPDSYTYLCDQVFASINGTATFNMSSNIESIGAGAFNPTNSRTTQTINYSGTKAQWNVISKAGNWKTGSGTVKVVCSDGNLTF